MYVFLVAAYLTKNTTRLLFQDVLLIFVISGGLTIAQYPQINLGCNKKLDKSENHTVTIHPGDVVGGLAVLTGESSLYTIKAKHYSRVGLLCKEVIYK